jgi:hypothetical protein
MRKELTTNNENSSLLPPGSETPIFIRDSHVRFADNEKGKFLTFKPSNLGYAPLR